MGMWMRYSLISMVSLDEGAGGRGGGVAVPGGGGGGVGGGVGGEAGGERPPPCILLLFHAYPSAGMILTSGCVEPRQAVLMFASR